jgi:hypothetical protein
VASISREDQKAAIQNRLTRRQQGHYARTLASCPRCLVWESLQIAHTQSISTQRRIPLNVEFAPEPAQTGGRYEEHARRAVLLFPGTSRRPRPAPQSTIRYMGPYAMSSIGSDSTITTDFALTLDFVPYILQGAIANNLPGVVKALSVELPRFLGVMNTAYRHLADATFSLVHAFLWDRFVLGENCSSAREGAKAYLLTHCCAEAYFGPALLMRRFVLTVCSRS